MISVPQLARKTASIVVSRQLTPASRKLQIRRAQSNSTLTNQENPLDGTKLHKNVSKWRDPAARKEIMTTAQSQLGITDPAGWYHVTYVSLRKACPAAATMVTSQYSSSIVAALKSIFPEHQWIAWNFTNLPAGWWDEAAHRREFMDWLAAELQLKTKEDWYNVSYNDVQQHHGRSLFRRFRSLCDVLQATYPDHAFLPWRFATIPREWWKDEKNQRLFLSHCLETLGRNPSDLSGWYSFPRQLIYDLGGQAFLRDYYNSSLTRCLTTLSPAHSWNGFQLHPTQLRPAYPSALSP
eukprot:TRINITY_DN3597_c0_g1_i1.p1 TRINITY_DN3597_c0_g1~~TRINITY_DN3597_c0_g1_i1.p1  ORF type:complete len:295 (+),score=32.12 TRINITY_DN3597_c0_g1_i1:56-940(+)